MCRRHNTRLLTHLDLQNETQDKHGHSVVVLSTTGGGWKLMGFLGVVGSPDYREPHDELLKLGPPRVPVPVDGERFWGLVEVGSGESGTMYSLDSKTNLKHYRTHMRTSLPWLVDELPKLFPPELVVIPLVSE